MPRESTNLEISELPLGTRPASSARSLSVKRWPRLLGLLFLAFAAFALITTSASTAVVHFGIEVSDVGKIQILPTVLKRLFIDGCLLSAEGCRIGHKTDFPNETEIKQEIDQTAALANALKFKQKEVQLIDEDTKVENMTRELTGAEVSRVWHTMNDTELAAAALLTESRGTVNRGKVAFMFLTRGPLPLAPLWGRFLRVSDGALRSWMVDQTSRRVQHICTYRKNFEHGNSNLGI
jgi:hypothetical protein